MKPSKILIILILAFVGRKTFAANPPNVQPRLKEGYSSGQEFMNHKDWSFVENKGQLADRNIKFYGRQGSVNLYCRPGKVSFVFSKVEKDLFFTKFRRPKNCTYLGGRPEGSGFKRRRVRISWPQKI